MPVGFVFTLMLVATVVAPTVLQRGPISASESTQPAPGCDATSQTAHIDLSYADPATATDDPTLTAVDIYQPDVSETCPPSPILFYVHGGGWQIGDKANALENKRRLALERGWLLMSINYRLAPDVTYPVPNQDVADAIVWTLDHAADFHADPERVAIMGHSAGAAIVASVATDERYLQRAGAKLTVLDCAIPLDTRGYDVSTQADDPFYVAMFGTDPAVWADASPITHVAPDKGIPPFLIVTRGDRDRVALAETFADTLESADVPVVLLDVGLTHLEVNDAIGDPADRWIMPTLDPYLAGCLS